MNLDAYQRRIDYTGDLDVSAETLTGLHLAHATHIPFENLDILLDRPIRLDVEHLERKLVADRRGGYCFEQNLFFSSVLQELGFRVTRLLGRVRYGATAILPRTHMMLLVDVDGARFIADVGFGGEGLLLPVPFGDAAESRQFHWTYRVARDTSAPGAEHGGPDLWVMQSLRNGGWVDMYAFTLEPQHPIDYEVANHFTSTHPGSRFRQTLIAQQPGREARVGLRNRELTIDRGDSATTRTVQDEDELLQVLADSFGLVFDPGTRFQLRDAT